MAHLKKRKLKNGDISYSIQSKARDRSGRYVYLYDTWRRNPLEMTEYEAKKENAKRMLELDQKVKQQVLGIFAINSSTKLSDYIEDIWVKEETLLNSDLSELYVLRHQSNIKIILDFFKEIKLSEITPILVQEFRNSLLKHRIIHESAKIKDGMVEKLKLYVKSKKIRVKKIEDHIGGLSHGTYEAATRGDKILWDSAKKIADGLGIDIDEYFEKIVTCKEYSRKTIKSVMGTLHIILGSAKRKQVIPYNYASREFVPPLRQQQKKEVRILNFDEAQELQKVLKNESEKHIMWVTVISLGLFAGLRAEEIAGLQWSDFGEDENLGIKTLSIKRAVREVPHKGLITKSTKTASSERIITLPNVLCKVIEKYKKWYDARKAIFEEWKHTDRLFISDEGKVIRPSNYRKWLAKLLKKTNIGNKKPPNFHSLRHTNISLEFCLSSMDSNGNSALSTFLISRRAGHSNISTTTDIYGHFLKNSDIKAAQLFDEYFE